MKFLIIFGIVLLILIFLILFVPLTFYIEKGQGKKLLIKIKFLFFTFENNEKTMKFLSKFQKEKKQKKEENKDIKKEDIPFKEKIIKACKLVSNILKQANYVLSHIQVKNLYIKLICAEFDAAFTAISYGAICSAIYPLLGIIENKTKVKKGAFDLKIGCDYNSKKSLYDFNITFSFSLIFVLIAGIRFLKKNKKWNLYYKYIVYNKFQDVKSARFTSYFVILNILFLLNISHPELNRIVHQGSTLHFCY